MKFLNPAKVTAELVSVMEEYERYVLAHWPSASIVVHSDWRKAPAVGVTVDQHTFGRAVDFHVVGVPVIEAWLALERFSAVMGLGVYPHWKPIPGFHADVRTAAYRQRWARGADGSYLGFDASTIEQIKEV